MDGAGCVAACSGFLSSGFLSSAFLPSGFPAITLSPSLIFHPACDGREAKLSEKLPKRTINAIFGLVLMILLFGGIPLGMKTGSAETHVRQIDGEQSLFAGLES